MDGVRVMVGFREEGRKVVQGRGGEDGGGGGWYRRRGSLGRRALF